MKDNKKMSKSCEVEKKRFSRKSKIHEHRLFFARPAYVIIKKKQPICFRKIFDPLECTEIDDFHVAAL